jgi:hypothetical protein
MKEKQIKKPICIQIKKKKKKTTTTEMEKTE